MVSIIIPAYNEEAVIRRTISSLLDGADLSRLEIIVCCNGCSDRTAEIAKEFGAPVRVLETAKGSKTLALNMGDAAATSFPRIYLDADISLSYSTIKAIESAFIGTTIQAVAPRMQVDLTGRNWVIRAFYNIWLRTPYHLHGMIGSGVYALSKEARTRFGDFPDIIADDGFVRAHFGTKERQTLSNCTFTVFPPATFQSLLRIKTRAALGNKELSQKFPELVRRLKADERQSHVASGYWTMISHPFDWPQIVVYGFVKTVAALRAKVQLKRLKDYHWERDDSSRV